MASSRARRSRTVTIGAISDAYRRDSSSSLSRRPRTTTSAPFSISALEPGVRFGVDDDLDAAVAIFEAEHAHAVALACLERAHTGHNPGDHHIVAVLRQWSRPRLDGHRGRQRGVTRRKLGDRSCAVLPQVRSVAVDGVPAPEHAERLVLEVQLFDFAPGRSVGQRRHRAGQRVSIVTAAEKVGLPPVLVTLHAAAVLDRRVERGEQPGTQQPRRQRASHPRATG